MKSFQLDIVPLGADGTKQNISIITPDYSFEIHKKSKVSKVYIGTFFNKKMHLDYWFSENDSSSKDYNFSITSIEKKDQKEEEQRLLDIKIPKGVFDRSYTFLIN